MIAFAALLGGVASNIVASKIEDKLGPRGVWAVWIIFIVASIVAIIAALLGGDQSQMPPTESAGSELPPSAGSAVVSINASRGVGADQIKDSVIVTGDNNLTIRDSHIQGTFIEKQETHYHAPIIEAPISINALHQLPPPPHDFTGRERELNELLDAHERRGYLVTGVQGLGGVGKTALVLKLAERLKPRFPDAQLYLDLRGASTQPISVIEAMTHVIRAFHPDAKLPDDETGLRALYNSTLNDQRALVFMDNAADRAQVESLIPPAHCLLLVTSRQHFTLPGLFRQHLESMPPAESRELLLKLAPRIGEQANEIAQLCGYLPLALRIAASLLDENRDLSVGEYIRRLTDERRRLVSLQREDQNVTASLGLSYKLLSEELRELWHALAVFPETFELGGAATVWKLERDVAQDAISKLVRYSLVNWIEQTERYRLHELTRLVARQQMKDTEYSTLEQSHATHYCRVLKKAEEYYRKGGEMFKHGLDLFDVESDNIQAGHRWAVGPGMDTQEGLQLCIDYPMSAPHLLHLRQHPREKIRWLETMVMASQRLKQRISESMALGNLGTAYESLGDYRKAIDFYKRALHIVRMIGARHAECPVLNNLGNAYSSLGDYRRAIDFYKQSLDIAREFGDHRSVGDALNNLGTAYDYLGDHRKAIEFYKQNLDITREFGDLRSEGNALGNLGAAYGSLYEHQEALKFHKQHLAIACEIGDRNAEGGAKYNIALSLDQLGQRTDAIAQAEASLKIHEEIESPFANVVRRKLAEWHPPPT